MASSPGKYLGNTILPGNDKYVADQIAAIDAKQPKVNSIPASALGANTTTYKTYNPTPTASVGLAETAIGMKDAYIAAEKAKVAGLEAERATGKKSILDVFSRLGGSATRRANEYEREGLNDERMAIDELTSQIEGRGRAYDKQIQTLVETNPDGMLASGVEGESNRLNRAKAAELADLSIVLSAKTRRYDTAKSIIDQKADAETEDLRTRLEGLKFFYSENEKTLDDTQRTILADTIDQADREYAEAREIRQQVGELQLAAAKNGAPTSVVRAIGASQDLEGAMAAAGSYLQSGDGGQGYDSYTDEDKRMIYQAGLSGADDRAKAVFLNSPPAFRQEFIREGWASDGTPSADAILRSLQTWEAENAGGDDADLNALINTLRGG